MYAATILRTARRAAGLSLRRLGELATTSHSTLAAYEAGRVVPSVDTLDRIVRAAALDAQVTLVPRPGGPDSSARGHELEAVLELAAMFPARHHPTLAYPRFASRT